MARLSPALRPRVQLIGSSRWRQLGLTERDATRADELVSAALRGGGRLARTDHGTVLAPGSTVLLYTDGLVERRDRDIDEGTAALVEAVAACAGLSLDDLCDRVLERLFLPDAEDDVAVLAVRLAP